MSDISERWGGGEKPAAPVVTVLGPGFEVTGRLLGAGLNRVSDHINQQPYMLLFGDANLTGVEGLASEAEEVAVSRDEIVLLIPLRELRISNPIESVVKRPHRVRMLAGDWVVEGDMALTTGITIERFVNLGTQTFVPVTAVTITGPGGERQAAMALVHRRHIRVLVPLDDPRVSWSAGIDF